MTPGYRGSSNTDGAFQLRLQRNPFDLEHAGRPSCGPCFAVKLPADRFFRQCETSECLGSHVRACESLLPRSDLCAAIGRIDHVPLSSSPAFSTRQHGAAKRCVPTSALARIPDANPRRLTPPPGNQRAEPLRQFKVRAHAPVLVRRSAGRFTGVTNNPSAVILDLQRHCYPVLLRSAVEPATCGVGSRSEAQSAGNFRWFSERRPGQLRNVSALDRRRQVSS